MLLEKSVSCLAKGIPSWKVYRYLFGSQKIVFLENWYLSAKDIPSWKAYRIGAGGICSVKKYTVLEICYLFNEKKNAPGKGICFR